MSEKTSKTKIYHDILAKKKYLTVLKNDSFNFEFPKIAYDRICKFYGKLVINPISFVKFNKNIKKYEFKRMRTVSHVLGEKQIADILELSNNFAIVPKYFHEKYNEQQRSELSPKIKNNTLKDIFKKAGISSDFMLDYCEFQVITTEILETSKVTITYEIVENVFKFIPLLSVKPTNGDKIDFTNYSYRNILKKCGIDLEHMLPYLHLEIKNIDRTELNNEIIPLNEKVKIRNLKERIKDGDLSKQDFDICVKNEQCHRYNEVPFDIIQNDENEVRDLLNNLNKKVQNKKDNIKKYTENPYNYIIEIKDKNNKTTYIRKKIFDKIISDNESDFDEYKTNDIYENEIIVSKKDLQNYNNNPILIKVYNKKNPNKEFIFTEIKNIENIIKNTKHARQEGVIEGKNKKDELIKEKWQIMDIEGDEMPKLDESKPLYSNTEKEKLFEKTKNDLLDELKDNNNNKDIIKLEKEEIPREEIKNQLLSEIKDSYIKLKDSKTNKDIYVRYSQLHEINNHKQKYPFTNYEILNDKNEKVYITKEICNQKLSDPKIEKLILCYDETQKDKEFFVPYETIQNIKEDGDDELDIGNNQKIILKNLKIKQLSEPPKLSEQSEEEKMIKINNLINKINSGDLNKNYKLKDIEGKTCFIADNYINKLQNESKNNKNDKKYEINDVFGKNKIILNKEIINKDNKSEEYILIKNKKDDDKYLIELNDLVNNLKKFKSDDNELVLTNSLDNKDIKLNPHDIEIMPPVKDINLKTYKEKEVDNKLINDSLSHKNEIKERLKQRILRARPHTLEKNSFTIRRAIIIRKHKKDKDKNN